MSQNFQKISEACRFLLQNFPAAEKVKNYLDGRLGSEIQEQFQFGFFPDEENLQVLLNMVDEEILEKEKLIFFKEIEDSLFPRKKKNLYFENHPLIIPFKDPYGQIVGLVGRTLMTDEEMKEKNISKYRNNFGFPKTSQLFGLFENKKHILEKNQVFIVEGQFDVIKAMEKGFRNLVGIGSNNLSAFQFSMITRYCENVFLLLDNDEAGIRGRKRVMNKFSRFANIRDVFLPPEFKDIDQFLKEHDYSDLELLMRV